MDVGGGGIRQWAKRRERENVEEGGGIKRARMRKRLRFCPKGQKCGLDYIAYMDRHIDTIF